MQKIAISAVPLPLAAICLTLALAGCDSEPRSKLLGERHPSSNQQPSLKAVITLPDKLQERASFTFNGDSSVADGNITAFSWTINTRGYEGDQIALTPNQSSAELVVGELAQSVTVTVSLTVTTENGESDTTSKFVTLEEVDVAKLPVLPRNRDVQLLGVDLDKDGVRDDIEIAIHKRFPMEIEKREVNRMAAKAYNQLLNFGTKGSEADTAEYALTLAVVEHCYISAGYFVNEEGLKAMQFLEAMMFNTSARNEAEAQFRSKISGQEQTVESVSDEDCRLKQN